MLEILGNGHIPTIYGCSVLDVLLLNMQYLIEITESHQKLL